jgi:hypothetical protein
VQATCRAGAGHIVTNYHVVQGADLATVTLANRSTWTARIVGSHADRGVAVLWIDAPRRASCGDRCSTKIVHMDEVCPTKTKAAGVLERIAQVFWAAQKARLEAANPQSRHSTGCKDCEWIAVCKKKELMDCRYRHSLHIGGLCANATNAI